MAPEDIDKYFEILELAPDAALSDIRNAYLNLKTLYSSDSLVMTAITYEIPEDSRQKILEQIEEAYAKLTDFLKNKDSESESKERPALADNKIKEYLANVTTFSGKTLKELRERLGIELKDVSKFTRIRKQYLEDIELERFHSLPTEVYLRGYIVEYARYFSLDVTRVANDYIARYIAWKASRNKPLSQ